MQRKPQLGEVDLDGATVARPGRVFGCASSAIDATTQSCITTGERSAVGSKSGLTGSQSGPALKQPTPAVTAGRNPAARPSPLQRKTGRGAGQSSALTREREALAPNSSADNFAECSDDSAIRELIEFFEVLDRWDREAHAN